LALVIKEQTEIFLLDNDAFINKGNKQAAKRARVKPKSRKSSQTIQSGIDEYSRRQQLKDFDIILIIVKPLHLIMKGGFYPNHIFFLSNQFWTVTSSSYFSRSIVQII
jgi:hypothetical protein